MTVIQLWTFSIKEGEIQSTTESPADSVLLTDYVGLILDVLELSELSYERIVKRNLERKQKGQDKFQNNTANSDGNLSAL